jgi:hypothetical protein
MIQSEAIYYLINSQTTIEIEQPHQNIFYPSYFYFKKRYLHTITDGRTTLPSDQSYVFAPVAYISTGAKKGS